jgi:glycosyltransferase involved in cell wall biosynthesis
MNESSRLAKPLDQQSMNVLQVSPRDAFGGAERVAWNLVEGARRRGWNSWVAVGRKDTDAPHVLTIPSPADASGRWGRFWRQAQSRLRQSGARGAYRLSQVARWLAEPRRCVEQLLGHEDFRFPGCRTLLELPPLLPDLVHCHNLHGGYFDLRFLPRLSARVPVVLTLHDSWLLTGHCSHSMACDRWKTGCGRCPDLTLYPAIRRDATAYNWRRKKGIYARSRLYIATPCQWLMDRVHQSMLAPAAADFRVIPNGVDLDVFRPSDKQKARADLKLPADARILLFTANQWIMGSRAKDYSTLKDALCLVAEKVQPRRLILVALGQQAPPAQSGRAEIQFIPFQKDQHVVAAYYQAADVYVHSAHVDTFPTTILEALASGTPVVATAVCGIPEQVRGLSPENGSATGSVVGAGQATGILASAGDPRSMAEAIGRLLADDDLRAGLSANARRDACARFDLNRQIDEYLQWYCRIRDHTTVGEYAETDDTEGQPASPTTAIAQSL